MRINIIINPECSHQITAELFYFKIEKGAAMPPLLNEVKELIV